jgi:NADPH:quinone reductase-like Zn-dependent oxidoreductase
LPSPGSRAVPLGASFQRVFDPVGGGVFERSLADLAAGGRLVDPRAVESTIVSLNLWLLIGKRARIIGTAAHP